MDLTSTEIRAKQIQLAEPVRAKISVQPASPSPRSTPGDKVNLANSGGPDGQLELTLSPPEPNPPPQVARIDQAVEDAVIQKRNLLAVLSSPTPKDKGEVDLKA